MRLAWIIKKPVLNLKFKTAEKVSKRSIIFFIFGLTQEKKWFFSKFNLQKFSDFIFHPSAGWIKLFSSFLSFLRGEDDVFKVEPQPSIWRRKLRSGRQQSARRSLHDGLRNRHCRKFLFLALSEFKTFAPELPLKSTQMAFSCFQEWQKLCTIPETGKSCFRDIDTCDFPLMAFLCFLSAKMTQKIVFRVLLISKKSLFDQIFHLTNKKLSMHFQLGNLLIILAVTTTPKLRTVTNWLIMSLAVADLSVGVAVLPGSIMMYITNGKRSKRCQACDEGINYLSLCGAKLHFMMFV